MGVGGGIHADHAGAVGLGQPAVGLDPVQLIGQVVGQSSTLAGSIHDAGQHHGIALGEAHHIAAGDRRAGGNGGIGAQVGQDDVVGIFGAGLLLDDHIVAPLGVGIGAAVQGAVGGRHDLGAVVVDLDMQCVVAVGAQSVLGVFAGFIVQVVERILFTAAAAAVVGDLIVAILHQGEVPGAHIAAQNGLDIGLGQSGFSALGFFGKDSPRQGAGEQHCAKNQRQQPFDNRFLHRAQLLLYT